MAAHGRAARIPQGVRAPSRRLGRRFRGPAHEQVRPGVRSRLCALGAVSQRHARSRAHVRGPAQDRLYVTLFAEFQTYPCIDNAWSPDPQTTAYYEALKDQYRSALAIFQKEAPKARVSLGWGGWQASGTTLQSEPAVPSSGISPTSCGYRASRASSRWRARLPPQRKGDDGGARQVRAGDARVLQAARRVDPALDRRLSAFLSARTCRAARKGLFALSFMDTGFLKGRPSTLALVEDWVRRSGCFRCGSGPGASGWPVVGRGGSGPRGYEKR